MSESIRGVDTFCATFFAFRHLYYLAHGTTCIRHDITIVCIRVLIPKIPIFRDQWSAKWSLVDYSSRGRPNLRRPGEYNHGCEVTRVEKIRVTLLSLCLLYGYVEKGYVSSVWVRTGRRELLVYQWCTKEGELLYLIMITLIIYST